MGEKGDRFLGSNSAKKPKFWAPGERREWERDGKKIITLLPHLEVQPRRGVVRGASELRVPPSNGREKARNSTPKPPFG